MAPSSWARYTATGPASATPRPTTRSRRALSDGDPVRLWQIWFRPGLERRQRALVAVAAFTALRLPEQVAKFGQSALNTGLLQTEVVEAIIQTAPATGFPPALNALGAISAVFR